MSVAPDPVLTAGAKRELIHDYFARFPRKYVIETGIWNGNGSTFDLASTNLLTVVFAIETDLESCALARERHPAVNVFHGDSATALPTILGWLDGPALIWLDAHCMEEYDSLDSSPLSFELQAILEWGHAKDSVVLVDDLRLMGRPGYPALAELRDWLAVPWWQCVEMDDILRLTPRSEPRRRLGS